MREKLIRSGAGMKKEKSRVGLQVRGGHQPGSPKNVMLEKEFEEGRKQGRRDVG